jgi:hypothetical protein
MREALCVAAILIASLPGAGAQSPSPNAVTATGPDSGPRSSINQKASEDQPTDRNWHLRLGTVTAGYSQGPGFYPYGYPYYLAAPWYPFWGLNYPAYAPDFAYSSAKGEVRLAAPTGNAKVFVNEAYAGTADHLKHIWLDPGAYDLAVTVPGGETFQQRIYVLSGKTLRITASSATRKEQP